MKPAYDILQLLWACAVLLPYPHQHPLYSRTLCALPATWGLWLRKPGQTPGLCKKGLLPWEVSRHLHQGTGLPAVHCPGTQPHSPSSRSFRAAASRRVTLGGKRTRFRGTPPATSFRGLSLWLFSAWAHIFTCWARRFWACFSRSCVLIRPTTGISASSSRCSAMVGAAYQGGCPGHQVPTRSPNFHSARPCDHLDTDPDLHLDVSGGGSPKGQGSPAEWAPRVSGTGFTSPDGCRLHSHN
nr:uncharacterized protein LOC118973336 [Manis javanica]